jgi:hypothetical protein
MPAITTHPHFLLWFSTAYLVTNGDYESFNAVKGEIFAFFFTEHVLIETGVYIFQNTMVVGGGMAAGKN